MSKKKQEQDHIEDMLDELETGEAEDNAADKPAEEALSLEDQLKEAKEKILRIAADNENYQKRLARETDEKIKYANQTLLVKFLPVLDNFDLALQHSDSPSVEAVMEGVRLNQKLMLDTLEKVGLAKIEASAGDKFDPNLHEAIMLTSNPDLPDGVIALVVQNGYKLQDRIVRPAKVQVNKLS